MDSQAEVSMSVSRQHDLTEVTEIYNQPCDLLLAVMSANREVVTFVYAFVAGIWHRFYLDAGLLFWDEGVAPDEEEDLDQGEIYVDLAARLRTVGNTFKEIRMANSRLTLRFSGGARLVLEEIDDVTIIAENVGNPNIETLSPGSKGVSSA